MCFLIKAGANLYLSQCSTVPCKPVLVQALQAPRGHLQAMPSLLISAKHDNKVFRTMARLPWLHNNIIWEQHPQIILSNRGKAHPDSVKIVPPLPRMTPAEQPWGDEGVHPGQRSHVIAVDNSNGSLAVEERSLVSRRSSAPSSSLAGRWCKRDLCMW